MHRVPRTATYEHIAAAFARGTVVQTLDGPIAVEDLLPGDYVETCQGPQAILWIGSTTMASFGPAAEGSSLTHLTRVLSDSLGPARPAADVMLGPAARIRNTPTDLMEHLSDGAVLSPVADFTDGMGVFDVTPPSPVQLYHIAFRRHATFSAGGLEVESYHPGHDLRDRMGPTARTLFLSLFPHLSSLGGFGPLALPRVSRGHSGDLTAA